MKTALIFLLAAVAVTVVGAHVVGGAKRIVRDTSATAGRADANAGAVGDEAAVLSAVEDDLEGTVSGAAASVKHGAVYSSSGIKKLTVHKYD